MYYLVTQTPTINPHKYLNQSFILNFCNMEEGLC